MADRRAAGDAPSVLAVGAHPDDIEFAMAGTLLLLADAGCELHYITVANGSCGTEELSAERIIDVRRRESRAAADYLGAAYHDSLANDLEIFYADGLLRRLAAVVRRVRPGIMLVPSLEDYMEDHMITARLAVTAAFSRCMKNYGTAPPEPPYYGDVMLYHATPHILEDGMRRRIVPEFTVDVGSVIRRKGAMLACHESQKSWLDRTQGFDSYLRGMTEMAEAVGRLSGKYRYAEGWRRHSHVGFSAADGDPLREILADRCSPAGSGE
jgi:LmbE family N-acetylglucosaminyl deacetylase